MLKFQGKVALVTGSGTGIGQAIAKKFIENGASVIILGRGINEMFDTLNKENLTVDYVINNAGVSGPVTCFANAPLDEFKSTVDIHLTGTFWGSVQAIKIMKENGKIVTISTFFTEERPLEQRPYRFRSPYTASQGAKNRLVEAMSWELTDKKIISIGTNPGPVHSDRIYKTVYPKAAAEFLRVSGFEDLTPVQVDAANKELLPLLGEDQNIVKEGIAKAAQKLSNENGKDIAKLTVTLANLLNKIQSIAEKVQNNTSHMIADQQFLSQGQVAATEKSDVQRVEYLAQHVTKNNGKVACFISESTSKELQEHISSKFHSHIVNLKNPDDVQRWLNTANTNLGKILAVIHITGRLPDISKLTELSRAKWQELIEKFITTPAIVGQRALGQFVPGGDKDPRLYKGAKGAMMIIGPDLPSGAKVTGLQRAQVEVFRGALRPFTTTVNQELSDVLDSKIRIFTIFPGSVTGAEPNNERIAQALNFLVSDNAAVSSEVTFCVDESR
ncbi:MAG: SDR family NAD(P)-dependent oxidoreductase [Nitrosarchaeum sp.]|nr:SDR family NAD(P)-dependent oxidoreductase [Nitrosarchaeum sp.]